MGCGPISGRWAPVSSRVRLMMTLPVSRRTRQAGAQFKFGLVWAALMTFPLMLGVQEICDRTVLATGKSLGALGPHSFRTGRTDRRRGAARDPARRGYAQHRG